MTQRDATRYLVYVDGELSTGYEVHRCKDSAGAERLDVAHLSVEPPSLEDLDLSAWMGKEIELVHSVSGEVVHWGKVTIATPVMNPAQGEHLQLVSRCEKFHIGGKVDGVWVWDPIASEPAKVDHDLVFNPLIDGKVYGNLNDTQVTGAGDPLLLSPESVRTAAARTLQGANTTFWSLSGAVYYLLWSLNTSETYVTNRTLVELQAAFDDANDLVKDAKIRRARWLAEALDDLLVPLGYHWRINRTAVGARTFEFFRRGDGGTLVGVNHQRLGTAFAFDSTNVEATAVTFDAARLANVIVARGGREQWELTIELAKAWPTAADGTFDDELAKEHPDFAGVENVYRKWVLNEAGDYIGVRTELNGIFPSSAVRSALSDASILVEFLPRRRKLLPTLTLSLDNTPIGKSAGVELEYSNPLFGQVGESEWLPVGNWGVEILKQEAGIYIDSERVPEELLKQGANARIRATFTLEGDFRVTGTATKQAGSPQADEVPAVLDVAEKFRYAVIMPGLSKYYGSGLPARTADDSTAVQTWAEYVRGLWDLMDVGGALVLEGLDRDDGGTLYKVGQRVERIFGKNISFEAKDGSGSYPQIIEIERDQDNQTMTLHLQRFTPPIRLK